MCTPYATSASVIEKLLEQLTRFGLPETMITDNDTCFASSEFEAFLSMKGIHHVTSASITQHLDCLAKQAVQIVKKR